MSRGKWVGTGVLPGGETADYVPSKVMKAIVLGAKSYVGTENIYPSKDVFSAIGNLSFEQASTLRHRGALTAVSQTFTTSCQMSRCYSSDSSESLLSAWYKVGLLAMPPRTLLTLVGHSELHLLPKIHYEEISRHPVYDDRDPVRWLRDHHRGSHGEAHGDWQHARSGVGG